MSHLPENLFSFEPSQPFPAGVASLGQDMAPVQLSAEGTVRAQSAARQISYHWDIATDSLSWSANAGEILGVDMALIQTGRGFAAIMDNENFFSRDDTVLRSARQDTGNGVPYEIEYRLKADPARGIHNWWIADTGVWFAGENGVAASATGIMRVADERLMRDEQANFLSHCDPLTGMMNRTRLIDALAEAITVAETDKQNCAFAIVAINNLDVMNETYGFEVADEVIVQLGRRLRQVMRTGDAVARYSGSKFAIILNNCKLEELNAALERFLRAVRDSVIETSLGPVWALLSIGAVSLPAMGDNTTKAIARAEEALSEAFRLPSDGFIIYTSSDDRKTRRLLNSRCASEIVQCLREGLFKLAYQPMFEAKTGSLVMHEALLRMTDTTGALITAAHLVPIAESLGLVRLIDRAVLQLALKTLQAHPDAYLSVNISATTVMDQRWNSQLVEMIAAAPEQASRLIIEFTENAALANLATARQFVHDLRQLGCGVALDNFGAGFTSFRNLQDLSLSHIKLDGSYCTNLVAGGENHAFVSSMVTLARAFGLKVVAKWVDTSADAEALAELGVDLLQGNMLGEASITAPWQASQTTSFEFDASSLAPVDASHFQHVVPDITLPNGIPHDNEDLASEMDATLATVDLNTDITPALPESEIHVELDMSHLDDATLEAEIAALDEKSSTQAKEQYFDVLMQPLYETAMAQGSPPVTPPVESPPSGEQDIDDSLSRLRAALAELGAALGAPPSEPDVQDQRFAS